MKLPFKNRSGYEIDMTHGRMIPKIMRFALPLMLTSMLQLLYNAADVIVVGRFDGPDALAAVGSTGALINLIINIFLGLSIGTNVVAASCFGAGDYKGMQRTVHTSVALSLVGGVVTGAVGFFLGGTFLTWMGSPETVLPLATKYIRIYFIGMPFNMLYNFGAALLRAVGDTRRPLYFLMLSGAINVCLNLLFVIAFRMGIAGVAWATIISQAVSALLVVICLMRSEGGIHLDIRKLRIEKACVIDMCRVGLPAGFQSVCFSISNVLIQSTVNGYGNIIVAGNSASQNLEGFIYVAMYAFHQAAVTFVSANIGAGKNSRIRSAMSSCVLMVTLTGMALCAVAYVLRAPLVGVYSQEAQVIAAGVNRFTLFAITYWLCGIMDTMCGVLRGMGSGVTPMVVSIVGACLFRIFWIYVILPTHDTLMTLYISYPVSWILTAGTHLVCYFIRLKRFPVDKAQEAAAEAQPI